MKMQVILTQEKCIETLKGDTLMFALLTQAEKTEMMDRPGSTYILCLGDKVLREVIKDKIATLMWEKLE